MGLVSSRMRVALDSGAPLVVLAEIGHADGAVHLWSGIGALTYAGETWIGLGRLGRITGVEQSTAIQIGEFAMELAGLSPDRAAFLDAADIRGQSAIAHLACLGPKRTIVPDPVEFLAGIIDYPEFRAEEDGTVTIRLIGERGLWNLDRAQAGVWSSEEQNRLYPGDTGLDLIPGLVSKEILWRA